MVLVVVAENITLDVVDRNRRQKREQEFSDFVRRVIQEKDLKHREIERASGGEISHSYISKIISGAVSPLGLSVEKILALADGVDEPPERLMALLTGKPMSDETAIERIVLQKMRRLPAHWQQGLIGVLDMLHHQHLEPAEERRRQKPKPKRRVA